LVGRGATWTKWASRKWGAYARENLRLDAEVGEDELRVILAGNAAKLYDFDLEALAPLAERYGPTVAEVEEPLRTLSGLSEQCSSQRSGNGCPITLSGRNRWVTLMAWP